jgi:hypothetical protein
VTEAEGPAGAFDRFAVEDVDQDVGGHVVAVGEHGVRQFTQTRRVAGHEGRGRVVERQVRRVHDDRVVEAVGAGVAESRERQGDRNLDHARGIDRALRVEGRMPVRPAGRPQLLDHDRRAVQLRRGRERPQGGL